jgi:hypothetical protein
MSTLDPAAPATSTTGEWQHTRSAGANLATAKVPLGEELPIFCERCGYCLHGVAQHVCELCTVRQFHCPECGHHQPINTLRPAFQKLLGRLRAVLIAIVVFLKINFFGWLLFAWVGMGHELSYEYNYKSFSDGSSNSRFLPRELDVDTVLAFGLFALAFGMFGRMLLLRWRRGYLVGLTLAALVCSATVLGAFWRKWERENRQDVVPSPVTTDFVTVLLITAATVTLGATIVWGVWSALAHIFLPRRTSQALLDWQRSQSNESAAFLARGGA